MTIIVSLACTFNVISSRINVPRRSGLDFRWLVSVMTVLLISSSNGTTDCPCSSRRTANVSAGTLMQIYGETYAAPTQRDQTSQSSKTRRHCRRQKWHWNEEEYGHGPWRNPKPRMTVLTRPSSNLMLCCVRSTSVQHILTKVTKCLW
jgi:hypothetical protein